MHFDLQLSLGKRGIQSSFSCPSRVLIAIAGILRYKPVQLDHRRPVEGSGQSKRALEKEDDGNINDKSDKSR